MAGAVWTPRRTYGVFQRILESFEPPLMAPEIRDELAAFVARRKREGGAPTDL